MNPSPQLTGGSSPLAPYPAPTAPPPTFALDPLYAQYQPTDCVQSSIYDITFAPNAKRNGHNKAILVLDSRDRKSGTPSNYDYVFGDVIADVVAVELKLVDFPSSCYIVNHYNNQFYFQDTETHVRYGQYVRLILPVGNYLADCCEENVESIRSLLERGLNDNSDSSYQVTVNRNQQRFTIEQVSGSGIFNILFVPPNQHHKEESRRLRSPWGDCVEDDQEDCEDDQQRRERGVAMGGLINNTMHSLLGFSLRNYYGRTKYTSDHVYDLYHDKCIVLRIESDGKPWRRVKSANSSFIDAFAIFPFERNLNNFQYRANLDDLHTEVYRFDFKEPCKFGKIHVSLTNIHGQLIDFNGLDHFMIFEITSLSRFWTD